MSYIMIASDVISGVFKSVKSKTEVKETLKSNSSLFERTEFEDEFDGRRGSNIWGWTIAVTDERPEAPLYIDDQLWEEQKKAETTFYDHWEDVSHTVEVNSHYIKWAFAGGRTRNLLVAEITKMYTLAYMLGFAEEYNKVSELLQRCIKKFVDVIKEKTNRF